MRFGLRLAKIALLICLQLGSALAGNEHEHLQYLPRYEDMIIGSDGKLGSFKAKDIFSEDLRGFKSKFGESVFTDDEWLKMRETDDLEQFCEKVAKKLGNRNTDEVMKSLFQVQSWHADAKGSYMASGTWRGKLFQKSNKTLERSIENYLEVTKRWQNNKTIFSVPNELADRRLLSSIGKLFEQQNHQVQFLYSIPRNFLQQENFKLQPTLDAVEKGVKEGWLHGIDISGSIREDEFKLVDKKADVKLQRLKERMGLFFRQSNKLGTPVRVHAFEKGNTGIFYDAFWETLDELREKKQMPRLMRIGHIQEVDSKSLKKFYRHRHYMDILFEANVESNMGIQDASIKKLVKQIETIHGKGFDIMIGNDGAGILGQKSNYVVTMERLKRAGLSEKSLAKLIDDSFTSIPGTKLDTYTKYLWKVESDKFKEIVLKQDRAPFADRCRKWFFSDMLKTVVYSDIR